ncbi:MAG: hypothetical protein MJK12_06835 [Colwellia sp.]|nr:hypothetical protein [Colwellia sp.]
MKNMSLLKITAMVVTVAFASNFVNADDKLDKALEKAQSDIEKVTASVVEAAKQLDFSALIEKLDSDENGMLSEAEVSANQSQLLHQEFNKMDVNQDKQIDEAEYNSYIAQVSDKATDIIKNAI